MANFQFHIISVENSRANKHDLTFSNNRKCRSGTQYIVPKFCMGKVTAIDLQVVTTNQLTFYIACQCDKPFLSTLYPFPPRLFFAESIQVLARKMRDKGDLAF